VMMRGVTAADGGETTIRPQLILEVEDESDIKRAQDAVHSITIDSRQGELTNIINLALSFAERVTGMSIQTQGQQGENSETAQGRLILQNNAGALMRRITRNFDDALRPHTMRYYDWLLQHGDKEDEKGDFEISVKGASVFYERDLQNQVLMQMLPFAANPIYELAPAKIAAEIVKSQKIDPARVQYTEEEKAKIAEAQAKQPPARDPRVEVAEINAKNRAEIAEKELQGQLQKVKMDTDRDTVYTESQAQRDANQAAYLERRLDIEREIKTLDMATKRGISLEQAKVELAKTTMELNVQRELAGKDGKTPQVASTDMEPVGQAADGEAFQA